MTTSTATPSLATVRVPLVMLTVRDGQLAALIRRHATRRVEPLSLPVAQPGPREALLDAAGRELALLTRLSTAAFHVEQLGAYDSPARSSRSLDVAYLALAPHLDTSAPLTDDLSWRPVRAVTSSDLGAGAYRILGDGVEAARIKLERTPLATSFCPPEFTVGDLRRVYEAVWGVSLDAGNFHRKVTKTPGFLEATGTTALRTCGRPGQLYRAGEATRLDPPLSRPGV